MLLQEKSFPRGQHVKGPSSKSGSNKHDKKKDQDLFGIKSQASNTASNKKKKEKKKRVKEEKKRDKEEDGLKIVEAEPLTYSALQTGMSVLARVSQVRDYDMRLSLPGRLIGSVKIADVNTHYTGALQRLAENQGDEDDDSGVRTLKETFKPGQWLVAAVTHVEATPDGFHRVSLTLDPKEIYGDSLRKEDFGGQSGGNLRVFAAVQSVEDHGCVMDVGVPGVRAFLSKKSVSKAGLDPSVGQVIACSVLKADSGNVTLTADPKKVAGDSIAKNSADLTIHSLVPGTPVKVKVCGGSEGGGVRQGLKVNIEGTDLTAYVHRDHFPTLDPDQTVPENETLVARVLYILPTVNAIYLTLKPVKEQADPFSNYKMGDLVEKCEIVRSGKNGLLVRFPVKSESTEVEEDTHQYGFVSLRNLSEGKEVVSDVRAEFPLGAKKAVRIFQYDYTDGIFICSMQKTMLKQSVMKIEQLVPGDKVTAVIQRLEKKGLFVEIGKNMTAFIPAMHMSDVPLKNPEKKFKVGDKVKCRVLRVDPEKRKVHLTAKNILVNEDYPIVSNYDQQNVGKVTEGVVVSLSTEGILLQLFGEARGWVPKRYISAEGPVDYPEKLFFIGQSLKCKVMDVDEDVSKMTLSLIIGGTSKPLGSKEKKAGQRLELGSAYTCKVADVSEDGLAVEVDLEDGSEVVKCHVPKHHLTDHASLAQQLLGTYAVGDTLKAVCFERDVVPILTLKPFIVGATDEESKNLSFDDLREGQVMPAVVCLVKKYGVFVKLPAFKFRKSALIPTRNLADFFVEDPTEYLVPNETMFAKVVEKKPDDQKVAMSSKLKDVATGNSDHAVQLMETLLQDLDRISKTSPIVAMKVGSVVSARVNEVSDFGIDATTSSGVRALIPKSSLSDGETSPKAGDSVNGVVVHVEHSFGCVELCLKPDIVSRVVTAVGGKKIKAGTVAKADVIVRKSELGYVLACVRTPDNLSGRLVHVPTKQHINDKVGFADSISARDTCSIVIKSTTSNGCAVGVLESKDKSSSSGLTPNRRANKRQRVDSVGSEGGRGRLDSVSSESADTKPPVHQPPASKKAKKDINPSVLQGLLGGDVQVKLEDDPSDTTDVITTVVPSKKPKVTTVSDRSSTTSDTKSSWGDSDFNPWEAAVKDEPQSDEDTKDLELEDGNEGTSTKKKKHLSKKEAKALSRLEDAEIDRVEGQVISGEATNAEPKTVQDFDRTVLGSPDSSLCWIKYMAFHLSRKESDLARQVARRALEKINFRLETERLNVYMAWFNLENTFGKPEAAEDCLKEALKCNDSYKVYAQAAAVYEQMPDKATQAEKLYKTMARKFSKEPEAWALLGKHYFTKKNFKEARFTLQRALQTLDKKTHVEISSRFGVLEFKHGESERGKSIFENIVSNYPRRVDQWNVYIDMAVKGGEVGFARELYDRMADLNLQPKKMKAVFKRYLEFETKHGDQQGVDRVRKKALEYVESKFGAQDKKDASVSLEEDDEMQDPMDQLMDMDDDL